MVDPRKLFDPVKARSAVDEEKDPGEKGVTG